MIFITGGTLAFFFDLLLLSKRKKSLPDKILTVWMLMIGLHLFLYDFTLKGIDYRFPHLLGIVVPFPLLHGPFLYLYTSALTGRTSQWKLMYWLHFTPILIFYLYYSGFLLLPAQEKTGYYKNLVSSAPDLFLSLLYPAIIASGFTYITLTFSLFRKHRQNLLSNFSNPRNNLHWLRNLIIGLLAVWIVVFAGDFVLDESVQTNAIYIAVVLFVASIGYFGVRQGNIFAGDPSLPVQSGSTDKGQLRYSESGLKEEQAVEIQRLLAQLMEEQKLYLDENLSLPQLAAMLDIHPNYLSQIINERFNRNYYDFVNFYRIEEFKRRVSLQQNRKLTIYALACDCGFNSKASFNQAFKKMTGTTPSGFIKSM